MLDEITPICLSNRSSKLWSLHSAGPLLLQIFCATHDSTNVGQKWDDLPDEGKAKEFSAAEAQNDFLSKETQAAVLDSLASCLANMANSLKVLTLGVVMFAISLI